MYCSRYFRGEFMQILKKIDSSQIKIGQRFSAPLFFDDGKNMFLAKKSSVKKYHIDAIKNWNLLSFLTAGEEIFNANENSLIDSALDEDLEELEELEEIDDVE